MNQKKISAAGGGVFRYSSSEVDSLTLNRTKQNYPSSPHRDAVVIETKQSTEQYLEVLLIHRNGLWDIPKGKVEKNETVACAARREVQEEVGIEEPIVTHFIGTTTHEYEQNNKNYYKTTYWYGMIDAQEHRISSALSPGRINELRNSTKHRYTPQLEEGITEIRWVSLTLAYEWVAFDNLRKVLIQFTEQVQAL